MADSSQPVGSLVASLRDILRRLDDDLVPPALDKVAAHSGKRLTPPLARRLLEELERNEWLRTQMLEKVDPAEEQIAKDFLEHEAGWWRMLLRPSADGATDKTVALTKRVKAVEAERDEAKRRLKDLRKQHDALGVEIRGLREEARTANRPDAIVHDSRAATMRIAELEAEVGRLTEECVGLHERIRDLRRRRPSPRDGHDGREADQPTRSFGRVGPTEMARRLDLEFAALTVGVEGSEHHTSADGPGGAASDGGLRLAAGLAPDSPDAIEWLTGSDRSVLVIVDGYNVTYLIDPAEFRTGPLRRRLVDVLARLRRSLPGGSILEVVFDSADGADSEPVVTGTGITVRFTATGVIADDEIVAAVGRSALPTVAISNDRELRHRVEAAGGLALWGDALIAWLDM